MTAVCNGCGTEVPPPKPRGRQRKWCSDLCRKRTLYGGVCVDCGASICGGGGVKRTPKWCVPCGARHSATRNRDRWMEQRIMIEAMWADGLTSAAIGAEMGWTAGTAKVRITQLRALGADLPYRRPADVRARIAANGDSQMTKARAARTNTTAGGAA